MYRMICCDLDETLLGSDKHISEKNIEAVKKAREKGVKFVVSTGRGFGSVHKTLKELGLNGQFDEYVISLNGGVILEIGSEKLLYMNSLPRKLAEALFDRGLGFDVSMQVYTEVDSYYYNLTDDDRAYLAGRVEVEEFYTPNLDFLKGQEIVKILYADPNIPHLNAIEEELRPMLRDVDVTYSSNRYLEFNHKGVSKGKGLLWLTEYLGIPQAETIAIGDNFNDESMMKVAGLGVCVRNGAEEMKQICGYVTEATNNENAVAEVIEKFIL